jgi:hypothetical protein
MADQHGLFILYQAILDGRAGIQPRMIRPDGSVLQLAGGNDSPVSTRAIQEAFPELDPEAAATSTEDGELIPSSPEGEWLRAVNTLRDAVDNVARRIDELQEVRDDLDSPVVSGRGIPDDLAEEMKQRLDRAVFRIQQWAEVFLEGHSAAAADDIDLS